MIMENSSTLIIPQAAQDLIMNFPALKQPEHTLLLSSNGSVNDHDDSDIEMFDLEISKSYTSLKDLISESPPAATAASPTNGSWKEIPFKDPLMQHAAWAYLQPTVAAAEDNGGYWWRRFQEKCCGAVFSCFNDVVLVMFKGTWFSHDHQGDDDKVE